MDNSVYSFAFQIDNGIPIIPFYDEKTDDPILYDDLSSHISDCAEQWFKFQTNDPVTIIDRKYDKELKK